MEPKPILLQDALKQYSHDQEKIIEPDKTIQRFKERLATSGLRILDDIVRIDNGRLGIPIYFSICGPDAYAAIGNYKQMGKGATPAQSQASAVMELGERFSLFSFYRNSQNFHFATRKAIEAPVIDFKWIARSVEDDSDDLHKMAKLFDQIPMQWTWAYNLTRSESVMVPFNWFWTINEFNGSSAGNCIEEALCQGICEVVERHVSSLVSRQELKAARIDRQSIQDPVALELIGKYEKAGIELCLSDFTLEMGIPTIGALAWDPNSFPAQSEIVWTAGTTPSPSKGLCRALTEVAQLAGDFNSGGNYVASGLPKFQQIEFARHITHPGKTVALDALPDLSNPNIKIEVQSCVEALAKRGMEVLAVDVRHPVLDIPAFYTIIPGTQFRERAANSSVAMISTKIVAESLPQDQAIALLHDFNKQLPDKYFIQFYLGQAHLKTKQYTQATTHFTQALRLEAPAEDLASIHTYLGICYKEMGKYHIALEALGKAHEIDAERTDTLNLMGFCHYKLGAYQEAISDFHKVIALDPSSAIDYANLGSNYRALGDTGKAIEYYQLALALDSEIDFAREHLAQLGVQA